MMEMKLKYLMFFVLFLSANGVFAQKDTSTYYLTSTGKQVSSKDQGDFYVKISPPEPGGDPKLFVVEGYYNNDIKLFHAYSISSSFPLKLQGHYITYFKNGFKMSERNFDNGEMTGESTLYFPNGKLYNKISKEIKLTDTLILFKECRDSTGKILTTNGNGHWVTYNDDFSMVTQKGKVVNGLQDSVWTIIRDDNTSYPIVFKNGKEWIDSTLTSKIFSSADQLPEFPGGVDGFLRFLGSHIRYPAAAREGNIQGRVVVSFVVEKDGSLSSFRVARSIGSGCDEEAIRVIKLSSPWKPGMKGGRPVRIQYSVPINFTLSQENITVK